MRPKRSEELAFVNAVDRLKRGRQEREELDKALDLRSQERITWSVSSGCKDFRKRSKSRTLLRTGMSRQSLKQTSPVREEHHNV